jgi:hypothetical protein
LRLEDWVLGQVDQILRLEDWVMGMAGGVLGLVGGVLERLRGLLLFTLHRAVDLQSHYFRVFEAVVVDDFDGDYVFSRF